MMQTETNLNADYDYYVIYCDNRTAVTVLQYSQQACDIGEWDLAKRNPKTLKEAKRKAKKLAKKHNLKYIKYESRY